MKAIAVALLMSQAQIISAPPPEHVATRYALGVETSAYTVVVSPAGRVTDCTLLATSGFPELDAHGCVRVRQATFAPVKGPDGLAVAAVFDAEARWPTGELVTSSSRPDAELSIDRAPGVPGLGVVDLEVRYGVDGRPASCRVAAGSGSAALDAAGCSAGVPATEPSRPRLSEPFVRRVKIRFIAAPLFRAHPSRALANVYPERSQRLAVAGTAVLRCDVGHDDRVSNCAVVDEWPRGFEFGAASRRLAAETGMRVAADPGEQVILPFWFSFASRNDPAPKGWVSITGQIIPTAR